MAQASYQQINLTDDIVLSWPFSFTGGTTLTDLTDVNPDQDGWTVALPNATLGTTGQYFQFNNISAFDFDIIANDLITTIVTVAAGEVYQLYLVNISTANGVWRVVSPPASTNAIVNLTAQSSNSSITITNGVVSPPGGTINFKLPTSIFNLNSVNTVGFLTVKSTAPLVFEAGDLIAGENINITNPDGSAGGAVVNLASVITGVSSLTVGELTLTGSIIDANNTDGNVGISTNGTGKIQANGVEIDVNANITGVNNLTIDGILNSPNLPTAWCRFTDTITGDDNTIVVLDSDNVTSVTGAAGTYVITFNNEMANVNYGVTYGLGGKGGSVFLSSVYDTVREKSAVTIEVYDQAGDLALSVPNGVTINIWSSAPVSS